MTIEKNIRCSNEKLWNSTKILWCVSFYQYNKTFWYWFWVSGSNDLEAVLKKMTVFIRNAEFSWKYSWKIEISLKSNFKNRCSSSYQWACIIIAGSEWYILNYIFTWQLRLGLGIKTYRASIGCRVVAEVVPVLDCTGPLSAWGADFMATMTTVCVWNLYVEVNMYVILWSYPLSEVT